VLNKNNFSPRILYSAKLSFTIDGGIKLFHNKQKLKQYMIPKPLMSKILQGILHTEDENKAMKGQEVLNHRRRKDKYSESSIESPAHTQTLKQ
jgi:hypothetical protein